MKWWKKLWVVAIAALVALALTYGFMPKPVPVEVAKAARGPLRVTVEEEGKTRVIDRYTVSAPVPGYARRIGLDVGDRVEKGQKITVLEPRRSEVLDPRRAAEARARVKAAGASLRVSRENARAARAESDYASTQVERIRKLHEGGLVATDEFDRAKSRARQAEAALRSAEFSVKVAEFELEAARTALRYSAAEGAAVGPGEVVVISAPVAGSVLKVLRKSEGVVGAGEALLEIGDPRALEVAVDVLSDDAVRIGPGTKVLFERWGGEEALEGRVRRVEPYAFTKVSALGIEEQRVIVVSDLTSPPEMWERLGDGYRVEASFILWEGDSVLQVPSSALFRHGDGWALFVYDNGKALLRQVTVGHRSGLVSEIASGVAEGELVITHPDTSIEDGTRVRLRGR